MTLTLTRIRRLRCAAQADARSANWLKSALAATALCCAGMSAQADAVPKGEMEQVSAHMGQMSVTMPAEMVDTDEPQRLNVQFEPWQMMEDLFRNDIVLLMRHGPTDWTRRDVRDVAPQDCTGQRLMTEEGKTAIFELGVLLASNRLRPSTIAVSEWCRNQQTRDALVSGFELVDKEYAASLTVETEPALNLLLSLQGAPNVTEMREIISAWDGSPDADGPLLLISHYTNIAELTEFSVYEGEILVLDPKRDNRVLGYLRLDNAAPDEGHFNTSN